MLDPGVASFDAAVAVVSMHHVEPLVESCHRLGELVRAGGVRDAEEQLIVEGRLPAVGARLVGVRRPDPA